MTLVPERFLALLLELSTGLALLLAAVAVHGITAQAARRRTQEIAIRSDNEDSEYHITLHYNRLWRSGPGAEWTRPCRRAASASRRDRRTLRAS